jgi:outer membrane protein insertion porin family
MFHFFLKFLIITFLISSPTLSKNFNNILIKGNERISSESILVFSEVNQQIVLDENRINLILKKLYETGFFKDVIVKVEDKDLVIQVIENPIIQSVFLDGIKQKKIQESVNQVLSLKDRSSFNSFSVKKDEVAILNQLKLDGFYFSSVTSSIEDLGDNKVNLTYNVELGNRAKISKISFIGDKKFKDNKLRNIIISQEYKFWKIISGKKFLNENMINFDKRLLNNFYKNKGYYNVKIDSSFANFLGNDKFELIFNISSGKKYYFNDLKLNLPIDYDLSNFDKLNTIFAKLKGETYSLNSIDKILSEIDKIVLSEQYEFLKSTVNEEVNNDLINFTFNIQESEKFHVEKINIYGNNITRESVIRNNLVVDEGDAFNELLHNKSVNNLKSLNFFKGVKSEIIEGSINSQKIINITVEEKPTGEISAGAGLGSDGGTVGFSVKENNFLGRGIQFGSDLSFTAEAVRGIVSLNNPNYKGTNKSLNFSAESTVTDRLANYGYESNKTGFSVGSGFEYFDSLFLTTGISTFFETLDTDSSATTSIKNQAGSYFDAFFNYTLDYDQRNQKFQTTDGYRSKFTQNIPLVSDSRTLTNTYDYKLYNEWLSENILSVGFYAKTANAVSGNKIKLSDRLFLPANKLRGFESGKVGPKDGLDFIGGNFSSSINIATTLPQILPNFQNTNFSVFLDAANLWGVDYSSSLSSASKIRSTVGLAVDLYTPVGPLSFSFSEVISKDETDITESFKFNLGTTF